MSCKNHFWNPMNVLCYREATQGGDEDFEKMRKHASFSAAIICFHDKVMSPVLQDPLMEKKDEMNCICMLFDERKQLINSLIIYRDRAPYISFYAEGLDAWMDQSPLTKLSSSIIKPATGIRKKLLI